MYSLEFTDKAVEDLRWLKRCEPIAYHKAEKLLMELIEHPRTGTGKPELKKYKSGWLLLKKNIATASLDLSGY